MGVYTSMANNSENGLECFNNKGVDVITDFSGLKSCVAKDCRDSSHLPLCLFHWCLDSPQNLCVCEIQLSAFRVVRSVCFIPRAWWMSLNVSDAIPALCQSSSWSNSWRCVEAWPDGFSHPNAVFLSALLERRAQGLDGSKAGQYLSSGFEFPLRPQQTCETHTTQNINVLCTLLKLFACCWNRLCLMLPKEMEIDCKCDIFFFPL